MAFVWHNPINDDFRIEQCYTHGHANAECRIFLGILYPIIFGNYPVITRKLLKFVHRTREGREVERRKEREREGEVGPMM